MRHSRRLDSLPPYLFAELERKIAEKEAAGVDVISLGIGDPDRPTPALVVEAMQVAVTEPETHRYPSNRGRADFRAAVSDFYARRFDVEVDPETEVMPAIGSAPSSRTASALPSSWISARTSMSRSRRPRRTSVPVVPVAPVTRSMRRNATRWSRARARARR